MTLTSPDSTAFATVGINVNQQHLVDLVIFIVELVCSRLPLLGADLVIFYTELVCSGDFL